MSKPLTIETKVRFKTVRDGRKKLEEAPATPAAELAPVPREARLMALAIHFDRLIREGAVESYSEIARLTGACPAWITAIMKLADLPVPEQEGILTGRSPLTPACWPVAGPWRKDDLLSRVYLDRPLSTGGPNRGQSLSLR